MTDRTPTDCPDCGVPPETRHIEGCDVARCTVCGVQQLQCDGAEHDHDETPPMEMWTGIWPGVVECREFGWWGHWTETLPGFDRPITGEFIPCGPDHPDATEDLNRLAFAAALGWVHWDRERERFVKS